MIVVRITWISLIERGIVESIPRFRFRLGLRFRFTSHKGNKGKNYLWRKKNLYLFQEKLYATCCYQALKYQEYSIFSIPTLNFQCVFKHLYYRIYKIILLTKNFILFGLVWIDQNYENTTESRSFYMKIGYDILPTKGKERPALPSDGSGAWKLVYKIPRKKWI